MAGRRRSILALCLLTSAVVPIFSALASETISYTYDARGRLVKVARSGAVNDGVSACYSYDKTDNRSNVIVSMSSACGTPPPSFSINDISATEGDNLVLTVTKSGTTSNSFSVDFASANGTAASGSDYSTTSGTLTFAPADATKTITVATTDDAAVESPETVLVNLSGASGGATIADAQGVGTINDNDGAAPSFSIDDASATEGSAAVFTVTKTGSTSSTLSVNYATATGSAGTGDFTSTSGTLTFGPTETTKTIFVNTNSVDPKFEMDEYFYVNLSGATGGATISDAQGEGTIYDAWGSLMAPPQESVTAPSNPEPPAEGSEDPTIKAR